MGKTIGFRVNVIVEPDEIGFHAYCPALKGLHTCGDTKEEALSNVSDAVVAYLQSLIKHGEPIPIGISMHIKVGEEIKKELPESSYTQQLQVACAI